MNLTQFQKLALIVVQKLTFQLCRILMCLNLLQTFKKYLRRKKVNVLGGSVLERQTISCKNNKAHELRNFSAELSQFKLWFATKYANFTLVLAYCSLNFLSSQLKPAAPN